MANSPWQRVEQNAIFRIPHRKKPSKNPEPSQINTYDHSYVLLRARWDRMRLTR